MKKIVFLFLIPLSVYSQGLKRISDYPNNPPQTGDQFLIQRGNNYFSSDFDSVSTSISNKNRTLPSNNLTNLNLTGKITYNILNPIAIAESYCNKAGVISQNAKQDLQARIAAIAAVNRLTNLVDFCFLEQGMNVPIGNPVSWKNTGIIVGNINRLRGGWELPNYNTTNYFYFTNLPPTPNGRTLIWWGAGSPTAGANFADAGQFMLELTSAGAGVQNHVLAIYSGGNTYLPYSFTSVGSVQRIGSIGFYGTSGVIGTATDGNGALFFQGTNGWSVFCNALSSSPSGQDIFWKNDFPRYNSDYVNTDSFTTQPTVLRFGVKSTSTIGVYAQQAWWGIVRGWMLFDCVIPTNEVVQIDSSVQRVGVVIEGDSKSVSPNWWPYWVTHPYNWGIFSILTNSAVSGTRMSEFANETLFGVTNISIEYRSTNLFNGTLAWWKTNSTYPIIVDSIRGCHNDFFNTNAGTQVALDSAYTALTNCAVLGKRQGWKVMVWNCDLTSVTSSGGSPGNSNLLMQLNGRITRDSANWTYFGDVYHYFLDQYGNTPWSNSSLYDVTGVHELGAGPAEGTNGVAQWCNASLNYEFPPQPVDYRTNLFSSDKIQIISGLITKVNNGSSLLSSNVATGNYLWTNPFPYNIVAYVSGGTVSGIGINGTIIGAAAGSYSIPLQIGEWIGITNSGAPTLKFKAF